MCIEILSKDDSLVDLQEKVDEFQALGVKYIWIVDPKLRKGYIASTHGFHHTESGIFVIPGTPIRIDLAEVFAEFDEGVVEG